MIPGGANINWQLGDIREIFGRIDQSYRRNDDLRAAWMISTTT
jgi:hypothetical protein